MKINPIASNQTEVERANGLIIFYSYKTPVAAFVPGRGGLVSSTKYSRTTSKHVTQAIARWGCSKTEVSQGEIDKLAE